MRELVAAGGLVALLSLAGCAGQGEPEPTYATEAQVASVLAEHAPDWQLVVDRATDCRVEWAFMTDLLAAQNCYYTEQAMLTSIPSVLRAWTTLSIPESMTTLVSETSAILQNIDDVGMLAACGRDAVPAATDECSEAMASVGEGYRKLAPKLNAWSPYL